jgi:tubulin-folding cofactor B
MAEVAVCSCAWLRCLLLVQMTVEALKVKLSFHCGTSPNSMMLTLGDESGQVVASLNEDSRKLGFYSPVDGFVINIIDTDPTSASAGGWLEDTSLVQKYKMSDSDYDTRENTYRKWKVSWRELEGNEAY